MTKSELKTLKAGQKIAVSYKGIRPCVFKNIKGNCAFVEFDSGDGTGVRLHRVLATTLKMPEKKAKKTYRPSEASSSEIEKALNMPSTPKAEVKVAKPKCSYEEALAIAQKVMLNLGYDVDMIAQ